MPTYSVEDIAPAKATYSADDIAPAESDLQSQGRMPQYRPGPGTRAAEMRPEPRPPDAQSRQTRDPIFFGNDPEAADPGQGTTRFVRFPDRPDPGHEGEIHVNPNPGSPISSDNRSLLAHETIHDILGQNLGDDDLKRIHAKLAPRDLEKAWKGYEGDSGDPAWNELPAHMIAYKPGDLDVTPAQRQVYVARFLNEVGKLDPKAAAQLKQIADRHPLQVSDQLPHPDEVQQLTTVRAQQIAHVMTNPPPEMVAQAPVAQSPIEHIKALPKMAYEAFKGNQQNKQQFDEQKKAVLKQYDKDVAGGHEPLLNLENLLPTQSPKVVNGRPEIPDTRAAKGVVRASVEFASSLSSPDNLALIGGSMGLAELAPTFAKLLGAGFTGQNIWSTITSTKEFLKAAKEGDWPTATEALTKAVLSGGMSALGLKETLKGKPKPKPQVKPEPAAEKVQPSAAKPKTAKPDAVSTRPEERRTEIVDKRKPVNGDPRAVRTEPVEAAGGDRGLRGQQPVVPEGNQPSVVSELPGAGGGPTAGGQPGSAAGSPPAASDVRRVTGSADIPLTDEGRQHARQLAAKVPPDVQVFHADNERSTETGRTVSPRAQAADWLEPWKLGAHEGKPLESEREAINDRLVNRPDESPGVSPISGEKGESFNEVRHRLIGGVQDQAARMPGKKVLNITSGRALQIIDAWAKKGMPADRSVDLEAMTKDGEFSKPGDLFKLTPTGLQRVDAITEPVQHFAHHGATEFNGGGGKESAKNIIPQPPEAKPAVSPPAPPLPAAEQIKPPATTDPSAVRQFMGEETGTSRVGELGAKVAAILKADVGEMQETKAKRDAARAELKRTQETPEEKGFGQKIINYFTGERDVWGARVNQIMHTLRGRVPDPQEQEALTFMRYFRNKPQELTQFLAGTHPAILESKDPRGAMEQIEKLRPVILKALNPSERMKEADPVLTTISAATLHEGQRLGFLESRWTPEEYTPQMMHPKGQGAYAEPPGRMGRLFGGKLGKYFSFAERREYPSPLHAIADGVRPKTLNAFDSFTIHGDKFATARATHLLENELRDSGVGKYSADGKQPVGWVELAAHSPEFKKQIPIMRPAEGAEQNSQAVAQYKLEQLRAGKPYSEISSPIPPGEMVPDIAHQQMYVPKYVEEALRPITDPDFTARLPGFKAARVAQSYQKAVQLGLSLFHATTENYMALSNMGPVGWYKALRIDRESPDFLRGERRMIRLGGTSAIQGNTVEAYRSLQPGSIPSWIDVARKAPLIHQVDQIAGKVTDFTFGNLQRRFKVYDFMLHEAAWRAKHPDATDAEWNTAGQSIAKEINAVYGGLHYENLGINHAAVEIARAVLLAPDWSFSNIFNVKYALEGRTPAGKMARLFWARQLVGGAVATQMLSMALSREFSKNPTQVYFGKDQDGQEIYQNVFFKGASGDVINFVHNTIDYGFPGGAARTLAAKGAGAVRAGMMLANNEDYLHRPIVRKGMNPIASSLRTTFKIGEASAPIPFSVMNMYEMLLGPDRDKFSKAELGTTIFSGNAPRHVAPEGMEMTPEGLREKPYKESRPFWEQVTTGKP